MHLGIITDQMFRKWNIEKYSEEKICSRCEGTGNELYSMYGKCSDCEGYGVKKKFIDRDLLLPTNRELLEMYYGKKLNGVS